MVMLLVMLVEGYVGVCVVVCDNDLWEVIVGICVFMLVIVGSGDVLMLLVDV